MTRSGVGMFSAWSRGVGWWLLGARGRVIGVVAAATGVVALWAVALAGSAQAALPSSCAQSGVTVTCTFGETGAAQSFTVPGGVDSITVDAFGAAGGGNNFDLVGLGGEAEATLAVTSGDAVEVLVGGQGGRFAHGAGGFNGGGAGGAAQAVLGGGGGGASDVRTGTCAQTLSCDLSARALVAGGGGGSVQAGGDVHGQGGGGGYPTGGVGENGGTFASDATGGGGGGQSAPGGSPGAAETGTPCTTAPTDGTTGGTLTQDAGGAGGAAGVGLGHSESGGGGGGGGYWGGGGGGGSCDKAAGAGGGGSSFGPAGTTFNNAVNDGDGSVTITYTAPASALAVTLVSDSTGQAPGTAFGDKATAIQTAVNAGQAATACTDLTDYLGLVKAQTGKKLTTNPNGGTAGLLTADATNLAGALGC